MVTLTNTESRRKLLPGLTAVMKVCPTPVATIVPLPSALTVATDGALLAHDHG